MVQNALKNFADSSELQVTTRTLEDRTRTYNHFNKLQTAGLEEDKDTGQDVGEYSKKPRVTT